MGDENSKLYAYELRSQPNMALRTAPVDRGWMDQSVGRAPYRCLPLVIANQAGWVIPSPASFSAMWDGGPNIENVRIAFENPQSEPWILSHFGGGVVTVSLPYLFRTPRSVNLWVKGPSNWIKDGAQALEGIVETDWLPSTFTMNWKLTRPHHLVLWEKGEPLCMIVPVARGLAEELDPVYAPLSANPDLQAQYEHWLRERNSFLGALAARQPDAVERGWQRDYVKGELPGGGRAPEHQTRLSLREFRRDS